jgi:uncharacterized protein with ATP-grasp and redox domains
LGTFAHLTVTERMPRIGRQVLAENDFPPAVAARLATLIAELPFDQVRPLEDTSAPDTADWDRYVNPYLGYNWLEVPWFFAESYFYRRILEATGYFQPGSLQGVDPFTSQKHHALEAARPVIHMLANELDTALGKSTANRRGEVNTIHRLIVRNVWGNQADLSLWSMSDKNRPDHQALDQQQAHLLIDDSTTIIDYMLKPGGQAKQVDFILDNFGPELAFDIALADYLLSTNTVGSVRFHARAHPTFVSDTLIQDIHFAVDELLSSEESQIREIGERLQEYLHNRRWLLCDDYFWSSPSSFWEMPERIRQELAGSGLVISKGDYNYRRLTGDRHWPPTTPFANVVGYFPAPLVALRVLKSESILGLAPGKAEALDKEDPGWLVNGKWGVFSYSQPRRSVEKH